MVGRFQVMALLQAARATALGYRPDEAESLGLNRAIFYAAAKRGFKGGNSGKHPGERHVLTEAQGKNVTKTIQQDVLGDEGAYYVEMDGQKRYVMGDEILEPADFRRQVAERFGQAFPQAWQQAVQIVEQTDRATLESRRKFYDEVYKPRRDELAKAWTALSKPGALGIVHDSVRKRRSGSRKEAWNSTGPHLISASAIRTTSLGCKWEWLSLACPGLPFERGACDGCGMNEADIEKARDHTRRLPAEEGTSREIISVRWLGTNLSRCKKRSRKQ